MTVSLWLPPFSCQVNPSLDGVVFRLCEDKTKKWLAIICDAIESRQLDSGMSQKLSGKLMWCAPPLFIARHDCCSLLMVRATQHLFYRVGRAMIKAIFAQKVGLHSVGSNVVAGRMPQASHSGAVGPRLLAALCWWRDTLQAGVAEERQWAMHDAPPCRLFVDAASSPARLAAVLFCDGWVYYTDGPPGQRIMEQLLKREDKQITSLVARCVCFAGTCACFLTWAGNTCDHDGVVHFH